MEYKGYSIASDVKSPMLKIIKPIGRGSVPTRLKGRFTSETEARRAIDLVPVKKKGNKDNASKAESTSGGN